MTLDLIQKKGFLYDSSLQALDEPYEIMSRGRPTGIVELAIDWTLTETPYLGQNGRMPSPTLLYQLYKEEFDGAYDEGSMFVLTLHPDMLPAIVKSGRHEVGVHGWIHEFTPRLAEGEEERLLDQAIAYLTKATGKRPVGYRAPSWACLLYTSDAADE